MKISKIFASVAAVALAVSALTATPVSAAEKAVVDFEGGDCSFVVMNVDDCASDAQLSVVDYNGSKQLWVDIEDSSLCPKVWFLVKGMVDQENWGKIASIKFDITFASTTDEPVGWIGGAIGAAGGWGAQDAQVNPS